MPVINIS